MEKKKDNRGGARPGAGRPKGNSKRYSIRVPGDIATVIDSHSDKSDFIKSCIVRSIYDTNELSEKQLASFGEVYPASNVKELSIPFFDISIVAGFPIPLDNDERSQSIELLRMLCPHPESCYLIRVIGDSMIDAGISSGDIVIVDKSNRNPAENEVAVCEYNGEYTLKHFVRRGNEGWLVPDNPEFPEIRVSEDDTLAIWGTVTYIIHKPK